MAYIGRQIQEFRSLWMLLLVVAVLSAGVITSCGGGGGGGGSDGELCDQCGDDPDGPCVDSIVVTPGEGQPQCTRMVEGDCVVDLTCRRKVDEGQRRCFPLAPGGADVDYQFRCDGSRPGGTPGPAPSFTPTPDPTATAAQECRNGVREGTEECDQGDLDSETCGSQGCNPPGGILSCTQTCTFNYSACASGGVGCGGN